jgi:Coproporphyrinogen III oxidase and related Fe-S oxidoreductases
LFFFSCSLDKGQNLIDPYLDSLEKELKFFYSNKVIYDKELLSIYIGGGTPSTLSINQFQRLIKILQTYVPLKNVKEFTFEAGRPDTLDREKLEAIKMSPVTRLSINPQTMNDVTLKKNWKKSYSK